MARPHQFNGGEKPEFARSASNAILDALACAQRAELECQLVAERLRLLAQSCDSARNTGRDYAPWRDVSRAELLARLKANGRGTPNSAAA